MAITDQIVAAAQAGGVDPALAIEVATAESSLNPNTPDSSAGAIGLFQLMPATAAWLGVNPRDVAQNIQGGVKYLAYLLSKFGDVSEALAAYDWGEGHVTSAVAQYGQDWLAEAPSETQIYVTKILNALGTQYQVGVGTGSNDPSALHVGIPMSPIGTATSLTDYILLGVLGFLMLWAVEQ
jgi:soluble lytic murein transglycosylase-like protein